MLPLPRDVESYHKNNSSLLSLRQSNLGCYHLTDIYVNFANLYFFLSENIKLHQREVDSVTDEVTLSGPVL